MADELMKVDPGTGEVVPSGGSIMGVEEARAVAESQAGFIIAQRFPRDEERAHDKIMKACENVRLAEEAEFSFPKGGSTISGASIRLLEVVKQYWRNITSGIRELEVFDDRTTMMAYCYDLETNAREERIFTVQHHIKLKGGGMKYLDDPRDLYELKFNMGSRRERACMEKIIPRHIIDEALEICRETCATKGAAPTEENIAKMVTAFAAMGVTQDMLELRQQKKLKAITGPEFRALRRIFKGLEDGVTTVEKVFGDSTLKAPKEKDAPAEEKPKTKAKKKKKKAAPKEEAQPEEPKGEPDPPEPSPSVSEDTPSPSPTKEEPNDANQVMSDKISEVVFSKDGKTEQGTPWKLYYIFGANGARYSCYNMDFVERAESAAANGYLCEIEYKETAQEKIVMNLELHG